MTLDTLARGLATTLLSQYGKALVLRRVVAGSYNAATGTTAAGTTTTLNVYGYIDGVTKLYGTAAEGLVQVGDCKVTIPAAGLSFDPAPGDEVDIDGTTWKVVLAQPTWSGEQTAMWDLVVRR